MGRQRQSPQGCRAERRADRRTARSQAPAESRLALAPVTEQLVLDQLHAREILLLHVEPLEGCNLVEVEQYVAAERVLNTALDKGDRHEALALGHRIDLVERV